MPQKMALSLRPGRCLLAVPWKTEDQSGRARSPSVSFVRLLIQEARRGSSCRCGRWRTTRWISTTWWTSPSLWKMIWTPSVTWATSWPMRWASSPATSDWASAPLWTKTCPLTPTLRKNIGRIRATGRLGLCSSALVTEWFTACFIRMFCWSRDSCDWRQDTRMFLVQCSTSKTQYSLISVKKWTELVFLMKGFSSSGLMKEIAKIWGKLPNLWDFDLFSTWGGHL